MVTDTGPVIAELANGRVHAQHGPIDLVITVDAPPKARAAALLSLQNTLDGLLEALVYDLPILRSAADATLVGSTPTSERMITATSRLADVAYLTPMAAVAGSVADTICEAMWRQDIDRLIVNNGGDIAFRLGEDHTMTVALATVTSGEIQGGVRLDATDGLGGVATSGRGGRSLTMGIADSVTVFADDAASADAAATIIANAVDLPESSSISRRPASEIDDNTDVGDRLVVTEVGQLSVDEQRRALTAGLELAQQLRDRGVLAATVLQLGSSEAVLPIGPSSAARFLDPGESQRIGIDL